METRRVQSFGEVVERLDAVVKRLEHVLGNQDRLDAPTLTPEQRQAIEIEGARHLAKNWQGVLPPDELEQMMQSIYANNVEALHACLDELRRRT